MHTMPPVSSFLIRHQHAVHASWFTSDKMLLEFHRELPMEEVLQLVADLINAVHPVKAQLQRDQYLSLAIDLPQSHA